MRRQKNLITDPINPASVPCRKPAPPCTLVIFGITGDLTKRLLYPALCNLGSSGLLDKNFSIIGIGRKTMSTKSFRQLLVKDIQEFVKDPDAKKFGAELAKNICYIEGDVNDSKMYTELKKKLKDITIEKANQNYLFYLAIPPDIITAVVTRLARAQLLTEKTSKYFRRIIIEKPFGHDLESAKELNKQLLSIVTEKQIFRIDHFLGKETVQNLLAFRFANGIFEPIWNRRYIDNVQITVAETLGVESRASYYEKAGALRDMVPNHIFSNAKPNSYGTSSIVFRRTYSW